MDLNRSAILVTPLQPYADWANALDDEGPRYEIVDGHDAATVFLGPALATTEEVEAWVEQNYEEFFAFMLDGSCTDEESWPRPRTRERFREWFQVRIHSLVVDIIDDPLELD